MNWIRLLRGAGPVSPLLLSLATLMALSSRSMPGAESLAPQKALALGGFGRSRRSPVHTDALEAEIVLGTWRHPAEGDRLSLVEDDSLQWRPIEAGNDGWFTDASLRGGYAFVPVNVQAGGVMLLTAMGHDLVYVNGELRAGDPYQYGFVHLPVALKAGLNELLFRCSRGRLKVSFAAPPAPVALNLDDQTLPDAITGENLDTWGAVVVMNATSETRNDFRIRAGIGPTPPVETSLPSLPPLSVCKVGFRLRGKSPGSGQTAPVPLELLDGGGKVLHADTAQIRVRRPGQTLKRTFVSNLDGSIQYWALNPAQPAAPDARPPALFFSLHGAGVEATGQADAYAPKAWGHLAAPTNRRPYGFDWESWGRIDALEVLDLAKAQLHPDPQRIYLTGHSMGGHGVWQLGALFPDRFAAIGPSAGWISFFSYAGDRPATNTGPVAALLHRAAATSDTVILETNYLQQGVYLLHGAADDNVPVGQARAMAERLGRFHRDFLCHEQPGAGHWWDASDEPGADCVDWAPMFDFFARHVIPSDQSVRRVNFTTVNPGVSASCHWLEIQQQLHPLQKSAVDVRWDSGKRRFVGSTENVARLAFHLHHVLPGGPLQVELDGQTLEQIAWPPEPGLCLEHQDGQWHMAPGLLPMLKGPHRYGPFKEAFCHHMIFVYGTEGTPEENAWAFNKARFDAESFWYRGNGSVDVVADTVFKPHAAPDRSVILYGNADSNGAWPGLLAGSPVQVRRGEVRIGLRVSTGDDLACLFLRPRPGSAAACVAVVSGTGLTGMRLTDRLPYFVSGVEYPDLTVIGPETLQQGVEGVRVAGFFGMDWSVDKGEFAWRAN